MNNIKKVAGYILVVIILVITFVAILAIWDVIDYKKVIEKLLGSLLVIFISSAVVLFITTVLIREEQNKELE
jgi:hypothetical protein